MPSMSETLGPSEAAFLHGARRAVLGTVTAAGRARLVPLAFAVAPWTDEIGRPVLYSALDEKPKSVADPRRLGRVRDILARPEVSLLVDRWDEDWSALAWLRLDGLATVVEPASDPTDVGRHRDAVRLLRERYRQYEGQALEARPVLRIVVTRAVSWGLDRSGSDG
jgi:PPOX class probable F420-dependent enzyme